MNESPIQNTTEEASVVGANLVSHGMTIRINGNDANTRVTNEGDWQPGDQVGLAWYNFKNGGKIQDPQNKSDWDTATDGTDYYLYANHIFNVKNIDGVDQFTTMTDVYEGAYFLYFPYEKLGGVKEKWVEFNAAPQTGDFFFERNNKAFRVSTQDFIEADAAVNENNELTKGFALKMAVNSLKVDVTPSEKIKENAYFQSVKISKLEINAGGNATTVRPFITKAMLKPQNLPKVTRDKNNEIDYSASYQSIFNAAAQKNFIDVSTASKDYRVITNVENDAYTLGEARSVRSFVFPISSLVTYTSIQYPSATVTVSKTVNGNTWQVGYFSINNTNSPAFAEKLRSNLTDGQNGVSKADIQLDKILSKGDNVGYLEFSGDAAANLVLANFRPNLNITSVAQWNDVVALYNAISEMGAIDQLAASYQEPTFTWNGTEAFIGEIQTPANVTVNLKTTRPMVIEGEVTWPKNLITDGDEKITVNGTLNVGVGETLDETVINANLTNNGTIYAGELASIGINNAPSENTVVNNGRIYVDYGAYVYPKTDYEGVIAYVVKDQNEETVNKIKVLVEGGKAEQANVNMLIVEGTTLDLNAIGTVTSSSDDRYEGSTSSSAVTMPTLEKVAIELKNGNIVKALAGSNDKVKSVTAVEGENSITDVQINGGDIATAKDAILSINSDATPIKATIALGTGSIMNKGTLNANTNVTTTNIDNEVGTINVAASYSITYSGTYTQGGTVHGSVNKQ